ncbi:DUF1330 domain-containing protein [Tepidicaulis sp.]|uniref:DUF1330 domain-containing protein n=1 Tax=Tepidicaulis sp. TaxID=1920809 RepID=UPI003B5CA57A
MTIYVLAQFKIHDRARYERYMAAFPDVFAQFGGTLLAAEEKPPVEEGKWEGDKAVLLAFPGRVAYERWRYSEAYREISKDREAATEGSVIVLGG